MGKVTGGSVSMEMAAVGSLHDVLHATVFQIISIATYGKVENVWHGLRVHITGWGP